MGTAFGAGFGAGLGRMQERRERKEALADEERRAKVTDLYAKGSSLSKIIPTLSGDRRDAAMKALTDVEAQIASVYHPVNAPGAIQRDWDFVKGLLTRKHPLQPVQLTTTTTAPTTPSPSAPAPLTQFTTMPVAPAVTSRPASAPPSAPMTKQQRQQQAQRDAATRQAEIDVLAASGLTPEEEAQQKQKLDEEHLQWQLDWAKRHGISGEALDELTEHIAGMPTPKARLKPLAGTKPYKGPDGRYYQTMFDAQTGATAEQVMPENYTPPAAGPIRAWKKNDRGQTVSVLLDRTTNAPIPGSENPDLLPPPYLTGRISTGMYHYIDEDNQVHEIPETRSSGPAGGTWWQSAIGCNGNTRCSQWR